MACHPDLVLRSKQSKYIENASEEMICRICNDVAEDAIVSKCNHLFDRGCIRDYVESNSSQNVRRRSIHPFSPETDEAASVQPDCPVCHVGLSIDLEAEAIDVTEGGKKKGKQGILGRLDLDVSKADALVVRQLILVTCRIGGRRPSWRRWSRSSPICGGRTRPSSRWFCTWSAG